MVLSAAELEFLRSQRIGRFATVGPSGWPHVTPVMYAVDDEGALEFDVDGVKLRNLTAEPRAAMVIDAMGPKRGIALQGRARLIAPEPTDAFAETVPVRVELGVLHVGRRNPHAGGRSPRAVGPLGPQQLVGERFRR